MSNQSLGNRVQAELKLAVESGLLPDDVHGKAETLLARLQKPVRLAIMGMPKSGKSAVLNLLVGSDVLLEGLSLPTMQLSHGETPSATCTLPDGSKQVVAGADPHAIAALTPVFVDMQLPLPALAKITVLEVVAPDDPTAVHKASQWAAKRSDVALWCTQGFGDVERGIWAAMPDTLKDHAFLMITKADELQDEGVLDATVASVQSMAKDEFNQILPIATLSAIASRQADGSVNKDKMRGSGGLALISAVLKQVEMGRQSVVDMADVLLHQHADDLAALKTAEKTPEPIPEPASAPEEETLAPPEPEAAAPAPEPAAEPKPEPAPTPESVAPPQDRATPGESPAMTRLRAIAEKKTAAKQAATDPEPEPAPAAPAAAPAPVQVILSDATRDAYEHVVAYLEEQGDVLAQTIETSGKNAPSAIMALTVEQIQWLTDYLNENGDDSDPSLLRARDTAFDAADMVQLMQMEKRDSAALEAVSLMLQIKKELQADLAA
ncbi:hypothetical protein [Loktanella sp. Alg231-35]|uniref:hypothetical protein n=1 Tax=Loktanella sp. Alg231-35 TaxID=1922220 RepID=UPI000D551B04|nr:hypothetical protein [Loktanella sp. Alg231-35]